MWGDVLPVVTAVTVAALGLAGTVWVKRLSRRTDNAAAEKTDAERRDIEVETARKLLADIQDMLDRRTERYERDLRDLRERLSQMEDRERAFFASFAGHATWDRAAAAALKAVNPGFPEPPPIYAPSGARWH